MTPPPESSDTRTLTCIGRRAVSLNFIIVEFVRATTRNCNNLMACLCTVVLSLYQKAVSAG